MSNATPIFVSIGSNINPQDNTRRAIHTLKSALTDCHVSRIYRSPSIGMNSTDFINAVVGGCTFHSLHTTQQWLREIEDNHGRVRSDNKFIDRPLDLDLLLYGHCVEGSVPHHDIAEQAYVLQPLWELASSLIHPTLNLSMTELRERLLKQSPEKFSALTPVTIDGC